VSEDQDSRLVYQAFPRWRDDPYQNEAVHAMLRLLHAADAVRTKLRALDEAMAFFLADPPLSLTFHAPARGAESCAVSLVALANEIRKAVKDLQGLEPYAVQFEPGSRGPG